LKKKQIKIRAMEQLPNLINSLSLYIPNANILHFIEIIKGVFSISSGGVTQLNISRYCSISYRSVQRFMSLEIPWYKLLIMVLVGHLKDYTGTYLLAIDETVEDKAGKETSNIGYFYSSKLGKVIRSISIGGLSLIAVDKRESYMTDFEPMKQDVAKTLANKAKKAAVKQKKKDKAAGIVEESKAPGRPSGSKNKVKVKVESESSRVLEVLLKRVLPFLATVFINPTYLVGDGAYGNTTGCLIAGEHNLFLISKLHYNTVLFYPPVAGSRKRKYGEKVDLDDLTAHKIDEKEEDDCIFTFFQIKKVQTRTIDQLINVVIIRCYNKRSKKSGFVLLFSTDLSLEGMTLVKYYSLRFQIEFNFRAAKQHFGLSDFKNIKPIQVSNAIGLSFFMDNLSTVLIQDTKEKSKLDFLSILDIKACFRAIFFSQRLNNTPVLSITNILDPQNIKMLANLGVVNMFNNSNVKRKVA
jgi:putative transposase